MIVEVCADGIASALAAAEGGAHRIELCADLAVGGITPSAGAIAVVCATVDIPVHVLVRPRGGNFVYSASEVSAMMHDIQAARAVGAAGVVLGALNADGTVDAALTAQLVEQARPLSVTFHKAFDATPDPYEALEALVALGIDRVLTSGHAATAVAGIAQLASLERRAAGRIVVMAGGRVTEAQLPMLRANGLRAVHVGSAVQTTGQACPALVRRFVAEAVRGEPA